MSPGEVRDARAMLFVVSAQGDEPVENFDVNFSGQPDRSAPHEKPVALTRLKLYDSMKVCVTLWAQIPFLWQSRFGNTFGVYATLDFAV